MVYTAEPTLDPIIDKPIDTGPAALKRLEKATRYGSLARRMQKFVDNLDPGEFGGISPPRDKVQFKHKHKSIKKKGGNPPIDYTLAERLVDLKLCLERQEYFQALPIYFYLRRMVEGG